jgi:putative membrane-bound dehydrogenase-like protein
MKRPHQTMVGQSSPSRTAFQNRLRGWIQCLSLVGFIALVNSLAGADPVVHDPRLELKLFAADPDIITPIGMTIDSRDRIFVIESHTHHPPADYKGPTSDRIKVFTDADKPDNIAVFAEGLRESMNLAFSLQGDLFVVCAREVWALPDSNGDGICDASERRRVLRVETANHYAHSCLLGITFSPDGWLVVSRGNNGSAAYTIHGTDGSTLSGYGDGGNVFRCRPDGSKIEEIATGFWNPFDLKYDHAGRLLLVDNDPDARGPNRLVHVVPGGDYGYQSLYGGGGNHPFQGWDGDLPGTLPYIDGTGEAPSGLLDCARAALPGDYRDQYLVTIWNEHTVARYAARPRGVSLQATHTHLVTGGQDFRPVAIDADSRGDIYVTDWVLVDYPNHGRGRIWKLSAKPGITRTAPLDRFTVKPDPALAPFEALLDSQGATVFDRLRGALDSDDPFMRHAAIVALAQPLFRAQTLGATSATNPHIRLGALLIACNDRNASFHCEAGKRATRRAGADCR